MLNFNNIHRVSNSDQYSNKQINTHNDSFADITSENKMLNAEINHGNNNKSITVHQNNDAQISNENNNKSITVQQNNDAQIVVRQNNDANKINDAVNYENDNKCITVQQNNDASTHVVVETNYKQKKFTFHDQNKNYLGEFGAREFIKYIAMTVNQDFLSNVNCEISRCIIEKYICTIKKENNGEIVILFKDYIESQFMGNIEVLIKFHNFIRNIENDNEITNAIKLISSDDALQIMSLLNKTSCMLMTHILKIIALVTNKLQLQSDCNTAKIKNSLLRYSVSLMYNLSKLSKNEVSSKIADISKLQKDLNELEQKRKSMYNNIDIMQHRIEKQDGQIDLLSRNLFCNNNKSDNITDTHNSDNDATECSGSTNSAPDSMSDIFSVGKLSSHNSENSNSDENVLIIP